MLHEVDRSDQSGLRPPESLWEPAQAADTKAPPLHCGCGWFERSPTEATVSSVSSVVDELRKHVELRHEMLALFPTSLRVQKAKLLG